MMIRTMAPYDYFSKGFDDDGDDFDDDERA